MKPRVLWIITFCAGISIGGSSLAEPGHTKVDASTIRVGDIVRGCRGDVCKIEIGPSPLPGKSRVVRRAEVLGALKRAGVGDGAVNVPKRRRVTRPKLTVGTGELHRRIRTAIESVVPRDTKLRAIDEMDPVSVPRNGFEIIARWPGDRDFQSRAAIPVSFVSDGKVFRTAQVFATFQLEVKVPVAATDLRRGDILDARSVRWKTVFADRTLRNVPKYADDLNGCRVVRPIREGETFDTRDIEKLPVVKRGSRLLIESSVGLVSIRANGKARQDGCVGDRIRASVGPWNRLLWVEVTGPGRAVVTQ